MLKRRGFFYHAGSYGIMQLKNHSRWKFFMHPVRTVRKAAKACRAVTGCKFKLICGMMINPDYFRTSWSWLAWYCLQR